MAVYEELDADAADPGAPRTYEVPDLNQPALYDTQRRVSQLTDYEALARYSDANGTGEEHYSSAAIYAAAVDGVEFDAGEEINI